MPHFILWPAVEVPGAGPVTLVDSLDRWTESARQLLQAWRGLELPRKWRTSDAYIPISLSALGRAWNLPLWEEDDLDEAFCRSPETISGLSGYLVASPDDIAVRWTVLAFLYDLRALAADDEEDELGRSYRDEKVRVRLASMKHLRRS
jgi:hypothetical protein